MDNRGETVQKAAGSDPAVESSPELDAKTLDWIAWAKAKADWYDPTVAATDPLFGKKIIVPTRTAKLRQRKAPISIDSQPIPRIFKAAS